MKPKGRGRGRGESKGRGSGAPPGPRDVPDERSPDVHVLVAIAAFVSDDRATAVRSARRAFLENLYLPAALRGAAPPKLGLVHGVEDARPEHAKALVGEIQPILRSSPDAVRFLLAVAATPTAVREREQLIDLARKLLREPDAAVREKLQRALDEVRNPARIASTSLAALAEVEGPQPGGCSSFDV